MQYDVIITTYGIMRDEHKPYLVQKKRDEEADEDDDSDVSNS